ncbi:MAG TPA: PAS domain S-box protein [Candidatus Saccharimonadales bacterium]|nr:PAS domain S-box protein [Candidatus Saccharimonadales bacterium]
MNPKTRKGRKPTPTPSVPTQSCADEPFCPIAALGASAGGLEVFGQFFDKLPPDTGLAFVLVQHLDPAHETLIPEILAKHTSMPVVCAEDGLNIQANHVYVIAPNGSLRMEGCTLRVDPLPAHRDGKLIDGFFRSIAENQKENVIGIILSGTGTDGTMGMKAIREHGGLTIAQKPETAKFDGMPRSAVASGFADLVLTVEEMPPRILEHIRHVAGVQQRKGVEAVQQEVLEALPQILPVLRKRTGHDFSRYKHSTLVRRIQRRMQVLYLDSAAKYSKCLKDNPDETDALFKDLLIGVTQFFRDPESFEFLAKKVIPELFRGKKRGGEVRVWVPGCASGEEAYSFAILLAEHAEKVKEKLKIQVFATDLDVEALAYARKARYAAEIADQLSPARLKKFFKKTGQVYEVVDSVREMCVFSPHNLIKDPPFSRLDLISCRNLLIYLEVELQKKLLPLFHYALNPSGHLFLGPSENVASRSELFRTIEARHRVFQRKPMLLHAPARFPLIDTGQVTKLQGMAASPVPNTPKESNMARSIERVIIEEYAPASVVINEQGEVMFFAGDTGKYLKPPAGSPNNKLVAMARENVRLELRTLIHRAISTGREALRRNLRIKAGRENLQIDLVVRPLTELGQDAGLYLVLFRELIPTKQGRPSARETFARHELPIIKQLEDELTTTREDLQTTIEELETSNEELKSANEELLSMNEELQSANEEMQTSKEEIQSTNDELQRKIEEAEHINAELRRAQHERAEYAAIVENSDDAIIGKTLDGTITSWNRAAERIFGYSAPEVIGTSILRIIPSDRHEEESRILQKLRRGEPVEHYETQRLTKGGRHIQVSLTSSPIRDPQGFVIGASKIARDITLQMEAVRASLLLAAVVDSSEDAIISKRLDGTVTSWNKAAEKMFGYTSEEMIGQPITRLFPEDRLEEEPDVIAKISRGHRIEHFETIRKKKDGKLVEVSLTISPVKDPHGKIIGASKIVRDITGQKAAQRSSMLLAAIVDSSDDAIVSKTLDGVVTSWNPAAEKIFGYTAHEMIGQPITKLFPPDRLDEETYVLSRIRSGQRIEHFETLRQAKDGTLLEVSLTISPVKDAQGRIIGASKIARDVTVQKAAARASQLLAAIVDSSEDAIVSKRLDGIVTSWNKAAEKLFGYTAREMIGQSITRLFPENRLEEEPKIIARIGRGERVEHFETVRKTKDGRLIDLSLTISPVLDEHGHVIGASKIARDISERRRNEEELRRNEEQLRDMADSIPQLAWMAEADGNIFWYNQRWYEYTGTTLEQMKGWGWEKVHDPELLPVVKERWGESLRTGKPFEMEFPLRGADGKYQWFLTRVNPMRDSRGNIVRWFGTNTNIDEAQRARQALEEERRILEVLNETGAAIASQLDLETLVQLVTDAGTKLSGAKFGAFFYNVTNEAGESFLLYTLSGAPREAFEKFGLPRNTPIFNPTFCGEGVVRSGNITKDPRYGTMPPHHGMPKGHLPVCSYLAVPVTSRSGEVIGGLFFGHPEPDVFTERAERLIVGIAAQAAIAIDNARLLDTAKREISQRKQVETELNRAKDELEERVKERTASLRETTEQLETFCYTVAHDLRSPLRAQQTFAQILIEDHKGMLDEAGLNYAKRILHAAERLDKLVQDLLTYARLSRSELKFEDVDLAKVLENFRNSHSEEIERRGALISIGSLHSVSAHPATLNLIVSNLIVNAMKFVNAGEIPTVEVCSERHGKLVRLWVKDNGIGIDSEGQKKIFGVFQRLHPINEYPGTGIGLAIVQKGVERMGGKVGVESEPAKGSRFWIELPAGAGSSQP